MDLEFTVSIITPIKSYIIFRERQLSIYVK